jgi:uncharacterized repeat protein (TIGR01451 family)
MDGTRSPEPERPEPRRSMFTVRRRHQILIATVMFLVVNAVAVAAFAAVRMSPEGSCGGGFSGFSGGDCSADLALTKIDAPDPVRQGGRLFYLIEVLNRGPGDAFDVEIADRVPVGMEIVWVMVPASSDPYGGNASCQVQGQAVFCNFYTVPQFHRAAVTIVTRPLARGTFSNVASVSSRTRDPNPSNNKATQQSTVTS